MWRRISKNVSQKLFHEFFCLEKSTHFKLLTSPDLQENNLNVSRLKCSAIFILTLIIGGTLIFFVDILEVLEINTRQRPLSYNFFENKILKKFLIKTPGCRIPFMEPFDPSVKKFIFKEDRPVCNNGTPPLVDSNLTSIFILPSSLQNYTEKTIEEINCCYQPFFRDEPEDYENDNKIKFSEKCIPFNVSTEIREEFIKVVCRIDNEIIYTDFFSFAPNKQTEKKNFDRKPLNVLILGIDAVSRLNFHRQMPKTVEYLKNITAVEMLGYNKVGDNTFPNLVTVLTGYTENELTNVCWPNDYTHFDDCPFVWKDYKKEGFLTSFGEDAAWMGIFNYVKRGFKKQPTDFMWGSFDRFVSNQIGNSHNLNVNECYGAREVYKIFLKYIRHFVTKMRIEDLPFFALFWGANLSHDYLNKPNLGDNDYFDLLKGFKDGGYLDNTVLFVMSDHGIRWGDIRQTYQGRMEERLPFLFVFLPDWYKYENQNGYNNLLKNARRLTTPFDLHETLKNLLKPFESPKNTKSTWRSYSLFNEIPKSRTCKDADIPDHWCTCQQSVELSVEEKVVQEGALFAVDYMNKMLEGYGQCAELKLFNVSNARVMTHDDEILNGDQTKDYMLTIQTIPGGGIFELTLRTLKNEKKFEVVDTISRLNLYGKQSSCIHDFHLKLYCYCKSYFGKE